MNESTPAERRRLALLQAATLLLPQFIKEAEFEAVQAGCTYWLREGPRRKAVAEALALLEEVNKQDDDYVQSSARRQDADDEAIKLHITPRPPSPSRE
jgi:hypothetical protein